MNTPSLRLIQAASTLLLLMLASAPAVAQAGAPNAPSQGTLATQLPLYGAGQNGSVAATQSPVPGTTTSVNTLNTSVQVTGAYAGGTSSTAKMPFTGKLSFLEAIQRGLDYNLGAEGVAQAMRQAQGQTKVARSSLLPNLSATASETVQQTNLKVVGLRFNLPVPGFSIPTIVGPYNYFDLRAHLTQTIGDMTAWKNYRSAQELAHSQEYALKDARDLVVLAVGGSYLQVVAAKARLASAQAQLTTATALYQQASQQRAVGVLAQTDVNRSHVQVLTQQERLESLRNDLAKQKINLARMTGLPINDQFEVSDDIPFAAAPDIKVEDALAQAYMQRQDLKASESQFHASELTKSAAHAERLPSLAMNGDYGVNGVNPNQSHGTFSATATLTVPIWRGGRTEGDIQQAEATFTQRRSELNDLHARIESDIRNAYLDLQAATNQVSVANENLKVTQETLDLTQQRFQAGVTDNVEVVQSEESVASAELDYINSVFAHNLAKLSLARAMGNAAGRLPQFLKLP
jgi:outer membrane protein TolC